MSDKRHVMILDANALLHRAWHALPPLTNPQGQTVNAVYGVMMAVIKLLLEEKPDAFLACWDTAKPTFRHQAFAAYKAQREAQPDELYDQIPLIQQGLRLLDVESLFLDGFEADDVIGTTALRAKAAGWRVTIITSDRDALQLVQPDIRVMAFKKGVTDTVVYDEAAIERRYGLRPSQFVDYKMLRGDPSDNIPGVKGIGDKGATDLLRRFASLPGVMQAAHDDDSDVSPSIRRKLLAAEAELPALRSLVEIVTNVPLVWEPRQRSAFLADQAGLIKFLMTMGFKTLINRVGQLSEAVQPPSVDEQRPDDAPAPIKTTDTLEEIYLERKQDARLALDELRGAEEMTVHVAAGLSGSLFAEQIEGLILGSKTRLYFFPRQLWQTAPEILKDIKDILLNPMVPKAAHDAKLQLKRLAALQLDVVGWSFDTLLAAYLLDAGERNHDLPAIALRYANLPLSMDAPPIRQAQAVSRLIAPLRQALEENHQVNVFARFELPLVPVLRQMERHGIRVDRDYLIALAKQFQRDKREQEEQMIAMAGRVFNPASPAQLAEVLFTDLRLASKGIKSGKTGFSTAASELEKLRGQHPIIERIESYRELSKLLSTYVEVLPTLTDADQRIHTTFNQAIAATGRLSSSDPNLQNIPVRSELGRKIRRAFIADKGYQLVSCDYSQIELRLVAALAHDDVMLAAFRRHEDIHVATAAALWQVPPELVSKQQRQAAKAINFGILYGQGPNALALGTGISYAEAKKFIAAYFELYHGIKNYMDETKASAQRLGYVETFFGRRRPLPEIHSQLHPLRAQAERMAINMPVQGTEADIVKLAMIKAHAELPKVCAEARLLLQVHDELLFEVPTVKINAVVTAVRDLMEHVEDVGVPLDVEVKAGDNWADMKKMP